MDLDQYQSEAARTLRDDMPTKDALANMALGLGGEVGEVIEPIKKHLFHRKDLDRHALGLEIGDVLWYLAGLASTLDLSLDAIAEANIVKLRTRHPVKFDPK